MLVEPGPTWSDDEGRVLVLSARPLTDVIEALRHCGICVAGPVPHGAVNGTNMDMPDCAIVDLAMREPLEVKMASLCGVIATQALVITASDDVEMRVRALHLGAADHVVEPYDTREVVARAQVLAARRRRDQRAAVDVGDVAIDPANRQAFRNGRELRLTGREFAVLLALARRVGRVVSKRELLDLLWPERKRNVNAVEAHVSALRRKLHAHGPPVIHTLHGAGYVLRPVAPAGTAHPHANPALHPSSASCGFGRASRGETR